MYQVIDGKTVATKVLEEVKYEVEQLKADIGFAVIIIGDDPASRIYVNNKAKKCKELGIRFEEYALKSDVTQPELMSLVNELNLRKDIHGIMMQHPIPSHLDEKAIWSAIDVLKDVDGFNPFNIGKLVSGEEIFVPGTPLGIIRLLEEYNIKIEGKRCVVVGRSNIVGKPMAMLFLNRNVTVTVCHSKTQNLAQVCSQADILVVAVGKANMITESMVKDGAVVIDVGINRVEGKILGDVDFEKVKNKASYITPVPGGVGPMTIAMLMSNILRAYKLNEK